MLPEQFQWITLRFEPEGDVWRLLDIARQLAREGNLEGAATVYDRAYGIEPTHQEVRRERAHVLDALAIEEHGIIFRYVPAGVFLMGNPRGAADEQPWHPVWLEAYWLADRPLDWETYCRLMNWSSPAEGMPRNEAGEEEDDDISSGPSFKLRWQYCTDPSFFEEADQEQPASDNDGVPDSTYATKPLIAVSWLSAEKLGQRLSAKQVRYGLPTEAQWEKAARGGLIGVPHAWGDAPPAPENCDCERFRKISILPSTTFPPNGYGLYAMNGGVWEWCLDWYDRNYYREAPEHNPAGPATGEEKVLRGGSWADCADVQTVSFRSSCRPDCGVTPNVGLRLCRAQG